LQSEQFEFGASDLVPQVVVDRIYTRMEFELSRCHHHRLFGTV